jgi:hypothetical protein
VNADGTVLVGDGIGNAFPRTPFLWSAGTGFREVQDLYSFSAISSDGSTAIGYGYTDVTDQTRAYLLTADGTAVSLTNGAAYDVSADGSVIVGSQNNGLAGNQAFRWTAEAGVQLLGFLPGTTGSTATFLSDDGTVVGGASSGDGNVVGVFRWTAEAGMVSLGLPSGLSPVFGGGGVSMSADGSTMAVTTRHEDGRRELFVWQEETGLRNLREILEQDVEAAASLQGWELRAILDISYDGRTLAGYGFNPQGRAEAWIAILDPPPGFLAGDYNENGLVDQADLDLALLNWGKLGYPLPTGWVNDLPIGHIDQAELDKVLLGWGNTPPVVALTTAVPEPQTWHLLIVIVATLGCARRITRHHADPRHHLARPSGAMFRNQTAAARQRLATARLVRVEACLETRPRRPETPLHADKPHGGGAARGARHLVAKQRPTGTRRAANSPASHHASRTVLVELAPLSCSLIAAIVLPMGRARADVTDGLLGYWPFDGHGGDQSGAGRHLDVYGAAPYSDGLFGQALDLQNNPNQYAQRPVNDAAFNFGAADFTVQAWVNYYRTFAIPEQTLVEKFDGAGWTLTSFWGSDTGQLPFLPPMARSGCTRTCSPARWALPAHGIKSSCAERAANST